MFEAVDAKDFAKALLADSVAVPVRLTALASHQSMSQRERRRCSRKDDVEVAYFIPHGAGAGQVHASASDTSDIAKPFHASLPHPCLMLVLKQLPTRSPHRKLYDIAVVNLSLTDQ